MKILTTVLMFAAVAVCAATPAEQPKTYRFNGADYVAARHLVEGPIETNEFTRPGETLLNWRQLVTHQQVTTQATLEQMSFRADAYALHIQAQLKRDAVAQPTYWEMLYSGKEAAVFAVRFGPRDDYPAQQMVALVMAAGPNTIHVLQWAVKEDPRNPGEYLTALESWKELFNRQARAAVNAAVRQ